jgi:hypothetical protein
MPWNLSCETHKLLWIQNFHTYSPESATILSQLKFVNADEAIRCLLPDIAE